MASGPGNEQLRVEFERNGVKLGIEHEYRHDSLWLNLEPRIKYNDAGFGFIEPRIEFNESGIEYIDPGIGHDDTRFEYVDAGVGHDESGIEYVDAGVGHIKSRIEHLFRERVCEHGDFGFWIGLEHEHERFLCDRR